MNHINIAHESNGNKKAKKQCHRRIAGCAVERQPFHSKYIFIMSWIIFFIFYIPHSLISYCLLLNRSFCASSSYYLHYHDDVTNVKFSRFFNFPFIIFLLSWGKNFGVDFLHRNFLLVLWIKNASIILRLVFLFFCRTSSILWVFHITSKTYS